MNALISLLGEEFCRNLVMALAHTLWQGLLVAGLLYAYLRTVPATAANRRYATGAVSLLAIVLGGLLTWSILNYAPAHSAQVIADSTDEIHSPGLSTNTPLVVTPSGIPRSEGVSPLIQDPDTRDTGHWQVWATGAWLIGVAAMLLRAVAIMTGGGRLRKRCVPVEDETILTLVEQLRRTMRIGRRIRVVVGESITIPGVVGCLWPTLLLPAALLSGTPADDLRAILAHELAHIRRFDYLVNFGQMVVEALLFFNPAVWWVSRQIRIEREACCDMAGVALTGRKTQYAETLVSWAQRLRDRHVAAAPAMAGLVDGRDEGTLLDRVRRIVIAGHRPRLRVSWPGSMAMLLLSGLALAALWQGTDLAVAFAGNILTPQERIEKIAEISREYGSEDKEFGEKDKVLVSGTVKTYDGKPLPKRPRMSIRSERSRHHSLATVYISTKDQPDGTGTFIYCANYGRIRVEAYADGYASAFAGPFDPKPGGTIEGVELVLGEGFPTTVLVVNERGRPIEGAQIIGGYRYSDDASSHHTIKLTTDPDGIATLEHAAEHRVGLQIEADGFEPERIGDIVFKRDQTSTVTLLATKPATGIVLSKATGEPIAGARIRALLSRTGNSTFGETSIHGDPDAVTEKDGRFALTRLRSARDYLVLVQADRYAHQYISQVRAGDNDVTVELGPERVIRGTVLGELDRLDTDRNGMPCIHFRNMYELGNHREMNSRETSPIRIDNGVGHFEITGFHGQTVDIAAGGKNVTVDVEEDDLNNVVIELPPESKIMREVVLVFKVPADSPAIQGGVRMDYVPEGERGYKPNWMEIADGQARCEVLVPCRYKYSVDYYQGKRPVGYWFKEADPIEISIGDEPFVIDVPVHPAGAIYGRVLQPDGMVATNALVSLIVAKRPEVVGTGLHELGSALNGPGTDRGRFNATPLPLGGEYGLVAHANNNFRVVEPLLLDRTNPIIERDIQLVQGVTLTGRLLDFDGAPARDTVQLHVSVKLGDHSWGTQGTEIRPDESGSFAFDNLNPDFQGQYFVHVSVQPGYRPVRHEVTDVTNPVVIRLEQAERLRGVVIDEATGWPIPDAEVHAYYSDSGAYENLKAERKTDERGEFVFSNMAARPYRLMVGGASLVPSHSTTRATGGQAEPVVLRVTISDWSDLKPQPPQGD